MINGNQTNLATDTFATWLYNTNQVALAVNNNMVSVDGTATGNVSTGNGFVNGTFSSTVLVANGYLRGGSVSTPNTLTVDGGIAVTNSAATINIFSMLGGRLNSTSNAAQQIDTFSLSSYRSAKYVIQVNMPSAGAQCSELLITQNTAAVVLTEYGTVCTNTSGPIAVFTASISSGNAVITMTPLVNTTIAGGGVNAVFQKTILSV